MTDDTTESREVILAVFDVCRTRRLAIAGRGVLRYGLMALLLLFGSYKFAAFEAEGIRGLLEHSPILSWLYPLLGIRGASALIGAVEISAAVLIGLRRWLPGLSAVGGLLASCTFMVTLSFLVTTPGALAPTSPFGGFLMKDIVLLGAALYTTSEALDAARSRGASRRR